ncbi:Methionine synthase reductase [Smittium mucronatum]|uniref:Methionine synthase reductase n=1 Tax=Smittium mucronatum TaxID=133383 RepID=A0A1R0H3K0_9FUNG|nr:Methionine synthase reductase [Smittium mucronatum]
MTSQNLKIFYASESGNSEAISIEIEKKLKEIGINSSVKQLNSFLKTDFSSDSKAIFVISTFGDGDPPSNSTLCFRKLARLCKNIKDANPSNDQSNPPKNLEYQKLKFCVLGLGDTNYDRFCNASKTFSGYLNTLGASGFYENGFADDAVGLELVVEPWIKGLIEHFEQSHSRPISNDTNSSTINALEKLQKLEIFPPKKILNTSVYWSNTRKYNSPIDRILSIDYSKIGNVEKLTGLPRPHKLSLSLKYLSNSPLISDSSLDQNHIPKNFQYPNWLFNHPTSEPAIQDTGSDQVFLAKVSKSHCLTTKNALKRTLLLDLDISKIDDIPYSGNPNVFEKWRVGDSFGIISPNDPLQISALFSRLNVPHNSWYCPVSIVSANDTSIPSHLKQFNHNSFLEMKSQTPLDSIPSAHDPEDSNKEPDSNQFIGFPTLFDLFLYKLDISNIPKKQLLLIMADSCSDPIEKSKILLIASRNGTSIYNELRSHQSIVSILDFLNTFSSCSITLDHLVELLPPLAPRNYSISSSPLTSSASWKFAFNSIEHTLDGPLDKPSHATDSNDQNYNLKNPAPSKKFGLCSNWLDSLCDYPPSLESLPSLNSLDSISFTNVSSLISVIDNTTSPLAPISKSHTNTFIPVFYRSSATQFRLENIQDSGNLNFNKTPILMICAGTGITPFMGFLEQLAIDQVGSEEKINRSVHLYYGCRDPFADFLFTDRLGFYKKNRILTALNVAFSRVNDNTAQNNDSTSSSNYKYVQDLLERDSDKLVDLVINLSARIYICGSAVGMGKDVHSKLTEIFFKAFNSIPEYKQSLFKFLDQPADDLSVEVSLVDVNKYFMKLSSIGRYSRDLNIQTYKSGLQENSEKFLFFIEAG